MAPASQNPYAPKRPARRGLDQVEEHAAHPCLICEELAAAGLDTAGLPEHLPGQHIGGAVDGDVILSFEVPAEGVQYGAELDPLRFTAEWWAQVLPEQVQVLHAAERRIPLPRSVREGVWLALGSVLADEEADGEDVALMDALVVAWQDTEDRAALEALAEHLTPGDWEDFARAWRSTIAGDGTAEDDAAFGRILHTIEALQDDQEGQEAAAVTQVLANYLGRQDDPEAAAASLAEIGEWLDSCEDRDAAYAAMDALVGPDGLHKVAEYDRAILDGASHEEAFAAVWGPSTDGSEEQLGLLEVRGPRTRRRPVPEGHVRVSFTQDTDNAPDGTPMGYGMTGDVPTDAKAAVAFLVNGLTDEEAQDTEALGNRARLVLAAELTRAPSARRKSVLDAVAAVLSPAEVEERTRIVDDPRAIVEGPADGDGATLAE